MGSVIHLNLFNGRNQTTPTAMLSDSAETTTTRTRPFRAGESSIPGGIFGGESSQPSTRTVHPTSQRSTVQTELFGGHAGWGTDDVQKTRLDPSAMVAAGTKKGEEEASRAAPLTERQDPNKSSITGGIFGPGASTCPITSQTKVDRNRSSIQGGIFG